MQRPGQPLSKILGSLCLIKLGRKNVSRALGDHLGWSEHIVPICYPFLPGHCPLLLSFGFISPASREMGCHVPHSQHPTAQGCSGAVCQGVRSTWVAPEQELCSVLCPSARLCLVTLGMFVPSHMLPTISDCSQALFAFLCNTGEAVLLRALSLPGRRVPLGTWCLSFPLGPWEGTGVSCAAPDCCVLWHQEGNLGVQDPRGSVLVLEATGSRQLLTAQLQVQCSVVQ